MKIFFVFCLLILVFGNCGPGIDRCAAQGHPCILLDGPTSIRNGSDGVFTTTVEVNEGESFTGVVRLRYEWKIPPFGQEGEFERQGITVHGRGAVAFTLKCAPSIGAPVPGGAPVSLQSDSKDSKGGTFVTTPCTLPLGCGLPNQPACSGPDGCGRTIGNPVKVIAFLDDINGNAKTSDSKEVSCEP